MVAKRKKRILAIDDEPAMTEWLKILLEHAGYEVRTALIGTRGEEFVERAVVAVDDQDVSVAFAVRPPLDRGGGRDGVRAGV